MNNKSPMQQQQEMEKRAQDEYIQEVLNKYQKDPSSLSNEERRCASKFLAYENRAQDIAKDIQQLTSQIQQAEARVRSLEVQVHDARGRAASYLEFMIDSKFPTADNAAKPRAEPPATLNSKKKNAEHAEKSAS